MSKWEYLVKDIDAEHLNAEGQVSQLNHIGQQGWELVNVIHVENSEYAYFKRPWRFKDIIYSITTNMSTEDTKEQFDILRAVG